MGHFSNELWFSSLCQPHLGAEWKCRLPSTSPTHDAFISSPGGSVSHVCLQSSVHRHSQGLPSGVSPFTITAAFLMLSKHTWSITPSQEMFITALFM